MKKTRVQVSAGMQLGGAKVLGQMIEQGGHGLGTEWVMEGVAFKGGRSVPHDVPLADQLAEARRIFMRLGAELGG